MNDSTGESNREYFADIEDGTGCVEIWEKLSEKQSESVESTPNKKNKK